MTRDEEWLLNEKYLGERTEEFFRDRERLKGGEPLAYVIGHVPFLNATIYLDSHPLIPRPETEYWVASTIHEISPYWERNLTSLKVRGQTPYLKVLDMCAGSGCIGVAVAKALPYARVDFAEIDTRHHPTIRRNIKENGIDESRTRVFGGNLFEEIADTYDCILSNPPYIDQSLNRTEPSVFEHEPHTALFANESGFELIKHIVNEAPTHLTDTGALVIEHEPEHQGNIAHVGQEYGFTPTTYTDQYGVMRYTILTRNTH